MSNKIEKKAISNMSWRFFERVGAQLVSFVVSIIIARIVVPEVYGIIAIVNAFISVLQVFVDSGLGSALIQKEDADDKDFSTVFYFNIIMSSVVYVLLFIGAKYIAQFYKEPILCSVIRVESITVLVAAIKNVQQAYVSKKLIFKKFFFATLLGTVTSAVVGVTMAIMGFGIWALVVQGLINSIIDTITLWIVVKWRPKLYFSVHRLKRLLNYGWKIMASSFLDTIYNKSRSFLIGKIYTSSDLAYYDRGESIPNLIIANINSSIDSVLLPLMSEEQNNTSRVKMMTRVSITVSTYLIVPSMILLAICAPNLVSIFLTDKWNDAVYYIRVFCFVYMFYPIHTANLNAIKAMGRSDIFFKLEIMKKLLGVLILFATVFWGVKELAFGMLILSLVSQVINSRPNKELLNYSYIEQMKDLAPNILLASVMGIIVYLVGYIELNIIYKLFVQIIVGVSVYIGLSYILGNPTFKYIIKLVSGIKNN